MPLTVSQQGLWYLSQADQRVSAAYNVIVAFEICGTIDRALFERGMAGLLRRHPLLGSRICTDEGAPEFALDLSPEEAAERAIDHAIDSLQSVTEREAGLPFDFDRGPLLRATLTRDAQSGQSGLALTFSHMVFDGHSLPVFLADLDEIYSALGRGAEPAFPLAPAGQDALAQREADFLASQTGRELIAQSAARLHGVPGSLALPTDRLISGASSIFRAGDRHFEIPADLAGQIRRFCSELRLGHAAFFLAATQVLLWQYGQQDDFGISVPINFRDQAATLAAVGYLTNVGVFRARLAREMTVRALLKESEEQILHLLDARQVPFPSLVRALRQGGQDIQGPLLQLAFNYQKTEQAEFSLGLATLVQVPVAACHTKNEFKIDVEETGQAIRCRFIFDRDAFHGGMIDRMAEHFLLLLDELSRSPEALLRSLPMVTEAERHALLQIGGQTGHEALGGCLHEGFERQAAARPDAEAVSYEGDALSYGELNGRANQLAHWLRGRGVGPDALVGICMERGLELAVALLGVLKAGGAYVPLDPEHPPERLALLLEDTGAKVVLTQSRLKPRLRSGDAEALSLDSEWEQVAGRGSGNPAPLAGLDHLAYCIYTSGSTGMPKAVGLRHAGSVSFVEWAKRIFGEHLTQRVLFSTSVTFDLSIFEVFATLNAGGTVVMVENALRLLEPGEHRDVAIINTVPSVAEALLSQPGTMAGVRALNLAGEPLQPMLRERLARQYPDMRMFNLYGPTETTTYSTCAELPAGLMETVSIGQAISNTRIYLLNEHLELVPPGARGEIHIAGEGLARGYLNRPELTAERFLPDPFGAPGSRMYKTGDLARYLSDGSLVFLGRIDNQVKIRGFRIEPGEIEHALLRLDGVQEAVVLARQDRPGDARLVAYLTARQGCELEPARIEADLPLPKHLKPGAILILDRMPLNPNGKIDRKRLPPPDASAQGGEAARVAPRTAAEAQLAAVWTEVLNVAEIGVHDDFFVLGGHSLLATHLVSLMAQRGMGGARVRDVFDFPTVAKLAQAMQQRTPGDDAPGHIPRLKRSGQTA
ncbi:non-ribosomal peptide synthetase [Chromobacterium vaccinii]|uniref:non-ribosomal peptide synthetase n=1 Tax=Chromobacterium vaccinii TaxID=1108595 RepID=UPI001E5866DD|nr:non-ribosomal peptide synthetase [Chromobacterium vaccinii]MCD4502398.1 amino acid adenylation domain-containing protein [Chromobacterium vaccinii]